jgi:ribosomal protein S18 acetylase RimI-like enzyme
MIDLQSISSRDYAATDRPGCLAVFDTNVPTSFLPLERPSFEVYLDRLPGPYLVLEGESGIVACGGYAVAPGSTTADLCWGMVAREYQGHGVGRLLVELRVRQIRRDPSITDIALKTSVDTCSFYEKLGFRTEQIVTNGIAVGRHLCDMRLVRGAEPRSTRQS